jgi:hypothetical protein
MRQIEKDMLAAIDRGAIFKQSNTYAHPVVGGYEVWLYQSLIAKHDGMQWRFNLCGYNTPTTRSRLNALGAGVRTIAGVPHVMGRPVPLAGWWSAREEVAA